MGRRLPRLLRVSLQVAVSVAAVASSAGSQSLPPDAREIFSRFSSRVVKIQVTARESGAKTVIGTGFVVSPAGHVVTNYHVVSDVVHDPDRYRAEFLATESGPGGLPSDDAEAEPLRVLGVDVIHDLAVLGAERDFSDFFELAPVEIAQGVRMFSMGNPHDLGLSIVEGTYNGLLEHALYDKIHLTAPLNAGMSGGPTIDERGAVVGVNVSTAGNEVSFLVPVERAAALVEQVQRPDYSPAPDLLGDVRDQLLAAQDHYLGEILGSPLQTVELLGHRLPSELAPFFHCWGDAEDRQSSPYKVVVHQCSTDDYVFLSRRQSSGIIRLRHRIVQSEGLDRFRFYNLLSQQFKGGDGFFWGTEDDVTPFRCHSDIVTKGGHRMKSVFCVRAYKKLAGLYDAVLKAVSLGAPDTALDTSLVLAGVSYENAEELARRFLEAIGWTP